MSQPAGQTDGEYMEFLRDTSWYKHAHNNDSGELSYLALGLAGETGEFIDEIKKIVRETGFNDKEVFRIAIENPEVRKKLIAELGDVLWYFTRIMDTLGVDAHELQVRNTYKLYRRLEERVADGTLNMELKWPFTDPFISLENVEETIGREENDVR